MAILEVPGSTSPLGRVAAALQRSWRADTAWVDDWDTTNPARGQCGSSALVVQDRFGGSLVRGLVEEGKSHEPIVHYWNSLEDGEIDTTWAQFSGTARRLSSAMVERDDLLSDTWLIGRYETLRDRVRRDATMQRDARKPRDASMQ